MGFPHIDQAGLELLTSSNPPASVSQSARIIGMSYRAWAFFVFLVETGFHHVVQAGLELLTSSNPPASTSQSAGITGISHQGWRGFLFFFKSWILALLLGWSAVS